MIEIAIGDCPDCFHWEPNQYGYVCRNTGIIYLGKRTDNKFIERVINHESLHAVLIRRVGKRVSRQFDNVFEHGTRSVGSDGAPNV